MGIDDMTISLLDAVKDVLVCNDQSDASQNGGAIGIGALDFTASWKTLKKHKITTISQSDVRTYESLAGQKPRI